MIEYYNWQILLYVSKAFRIKELNTIIHLTTRAF